METGRSEPVEPRLGLWDAVSLIVGIIIGVGIFETPVDVFKASPGPWSALAVWVLGGIIALMGAFCFAELASTYPHSGGEYVYITRAFGSLAGYWFAWAQLTIIRPGSIAAVAFVFATYAAQLIGADSVYEGTLAALAVVVLTGINIIGVTLGKSTQNVLTTLKVLGIAAIIAVGLAWGEPRRSQEGITKSYSGDWLPVAMISVLWTYAGWHEAGYVAAEVKNPRRNLPWAVALGTGLVCLIYVSINLAYWLALGEEGASSPNLATRVLELAWGKSASNAMAVLIVVSALAAANGSIFTTARIYAAFGADYRLFAPLARWHRTLGTPAIALFVQGITTVAMILLVAWIGKDPSGKSLRGLTAMINLTSAPFWLFFLLAALALFILRRKEPALPRPFRVPAYPLVPILFGLSCVLMIGGSILANPMESAASLGILATGIPFYFLSRNPPASRAANMEKPRNASLEYLPTAPLGHKPT